MNWVINKISYECLLMNWFMNKLISSWIDELVQKYMNWFMNRWNGSRIDELVHE